MRGILNFIGRRLARYLTQPVSAPPTITTNTPELLAQTLQPGDVLLIEGNTRLSTAIKYLTQSTWSHSAICIGGALGQPAGGGEPLTLVEADLNHGVRAVPLSLYAPRHTRICRPVGLRPEDLRRLVDFVVARIGHQYDLDNLIDLARYLLPTPPVPSRWRRRMIALGSGDPTRAICSTLIALAFQEIRYPVLPIITFVDDGSALAQHQRNPSYPPLQPVYAAGLRHLSVFPYRQAHPRVQL